MKVCEFKNDRKTYSATIREFGIIGEAVGNIIDEEIIKKHSKVSWRDIKDFRNILIHEYFGVDFEIVWNTIFEDLPQLKTTVFDILDKSSRRCFKVQHPTRSYWNYHRYNQKERCHYKYKYRVRKWNQY